MDKPWMTILLDSRHTGGIETHVLHLAKGLKQFGYAPIVLFYAHYDRAHPIEPDLQANDLDFHYLDGDFHSLYQWMKRHSPLLIHTHGYKAGITGKMVGWLTSTPVVSTFHNGDLGLGKVRLYTWLDQVSSRLSTNIAVSPSIRDRLPNPVSVINNFIDVIEQQPQQRQQSQQGQHIAFVGRLSHEKGPDLFLQLAKHLPDMQFTVYGSGPLDETIRANKTSNVILNGSVDSMEPHWQNVGLLCITSRAEGLPLVALEAMAHGIPVLSFSVGSLPELIEPDENGWLVEPGHIKAMSQLVQQWYHLPDSTKERMTRHCVDTIKQGYSYQTVIPALLEQYKQAVNEQGYLWPE